MGFATVSQVQFGTVINPVGGSAGDGTNSPQALGRGGDLLNSNAHGRFYQAAYRGNVFHARSPVAGSVLPIESDTTAGHWTFGVLNPAGSGRNIELLQARVDISATSTYIAAEMYLFAFSGAPLTLIIAGTTTILPAVAVSNVLALGGWTPVTQVLSVFTVATTQADKHLCGLGSFDAVATANNRNLIRNFDGGFIFPPGTLLAIAGSAAQTSIAHCELMYAEVPV